MLIFINIQVRVSFARSTRLNDTQEGYVHSDDDKDVVVPGMYMQIYQLLQGLDHLRALCSDLDVLDKQHKKDRHALLYRNAMPLVY
jgi:hypothetical protein